MQKILFLIVTLIITASLMRTAATAQQPAGTRQQQTIPGQPPADSAQPVFDTSLAPHTEIHNDILQALLYLPDAEKGYYRATRFDWSGVMPLLKYKGRNLCSVWFENYFPTNHEAITGPVESFTSLGYKDVAPGGHFVQIGVGTLTRPDGSNYSFSKYYPIADPGSWKIKKSKNRIEFRQLLNDSAYPYVYTKRIELPKDRPELILTHSLKNTGHHTIETDVFNHNFFRIDSQYTRPGLMLKFPFPLTSEGARGSDDLALIRGDSIVILRQLTGKESVYAILHGYGDNPGDYDIRIENRLTNTGIRITADQPLSRLVYWGNPRILCPEPYIHIKVPPGQTFSWTIRYEFYTTGPITN